MQKDVATTGLWLHTSGVLGASPDGLITSENAVVEIKCPFSLRNCSKDEIIAKCKNFTTKDGTVALKDDSDYYHQVQGQMHITGTNLCYFVTYTTECILILKVDKDDAWSENIDLLK